MASNATTISQPMAADYPAQFRRYIHWGIEHVLQKVQPHVDHLPDALREEAWTLLSFALGVAEAWPTARALLLALTPHMEYGGWWNEWIPYLERGIQQSERNDEPTTAAELWLRLGVLYRSLANYKQARACLQVSSQRYAALQDRYNQARALNRLAFLARMAGDDKEALATVNKALVLLHDGEQECAISYSILGAVAFDQREWQTAADYFQQALALHQKYADTRLLAWALEDLAGALCMQEKFDDAIAGYQRALGLLDSRHVPTQAAVTKMNLGAVHLSIGQPDKALALFIQAEPIFQAIQDERRLAMIYTNMGIAYRDQQQWEKAQIAFGKSISRAKQLGHFTLVVNTLDELGLLYLAIKDFESSASTFQQALEWLSLITNQLTRAHYYQIITEHIQQLSTKHEYNLDQ